MVEVRHLLKKVGILFLSLILIWFLFNVLDLDIRTPPYKINDKKLFEPQVPVTFNYSVSREEDLVVLHITIYYNSLRPDKNGTITLIIPNGVKIVEGEPTINKVFYPNETYSLRYKLKVMNEGDYIFRIKYEGDLGRKYNVIPLRIGTEEISILNITETKKTTENDVKSKTKTKVIVKP